MDYDCDYFISYAHDDNKSEDDNSGFVDEFVRKLKNSPEHKQMFGREIEVFFDKTGIKPMSDWDNRIRSKLSKSRFFVVLLSPNYFHSEYCAKEFDWWMQHEMHRRVLGEGTAPMLIVAVDDLYNYNVNPLPAISPDLQVKFPNWAKQIRQIQAGPNFDMHNLDRFKIDEILRALCKSTKDKYFKQVIAEESPINAGYPQYNEYFVGRRENLRSLRQTLSTTSKTAISAVNGLGGIGKTELALTYGHAFAWDYELGRVFATCENMDSLEDVILSSSIAEMHGLELKGTNEQKLTTLYNALKRKIKLIEQRNEEKNIDRTLGTHVLIILDNVNRLDLISQRNLYKLPKFFHVIITTRESANEFPHIHTESVDRLSENESLELLSNLRPFGDDKKEVLAAREIAKLLDGFTLAVELTGAYLQKSPRVTYQKQYERLRANISGAMETMADKTQELRRHQAECISVVLQSTLSALSDNARKALDFAALMSPDAVGFSWLPELLGLDEDEGWEVLDELTGYCLLTPLGGESNIARIHRLVAEAVKREIPEDVQKEIIVKIQKKCEALLKNDKTFWCTPENSWNITPVSEFCLALAGQWTMESSEDEIDWNLTWMLEKSGDMLNTLGKMNEARKVFQRLFNICEQRFKTFPLNISVQWNLGSSYTQVGDLEKSIGYIDSARSYYENALKIYKRLAEMTPKNVDLQLALSTSYDRIGDLEKVIGNVEDARKWYKKALVIYLWLVRIEPRNVNFQQGLSLSYNRLGDIEKIAGDKDSVRKWYKKALIIFKRLFEMMPENVDVALDLCDFYSDLGNLEIEAQKFKAAKERCNNALNILEPMLNKLTNNVRALQVLGKTYQCLGDSEISNKNFKNARNWYEKALTLFKQLAERMPEDIATQLYLKAMYEQLGILEDKADNIDAARDWYEKNLKIAQLLADKMSENANIKLDLCAAYNHLGDLDKQSGHLSDALEQYKKALEIAQQLVNTTPDNSDFKQCLNVLYERIRSLDVLCEHLGDFEKSEGNSEAAKTWYENALDFFQELAEKFPENTQVKEDLVRVQEKLSQVQNRS